MLPRSFLAAVASALFAQTGHATRLIESSSLVPCMKNSSFSANMFHVVFTADNSTLTYEINGESHVSSKIILDVNVVGYGYPVVQIKVDPCESADLKGLCPMISGPIPDMKSNFILDKKALASRVPSIVYYIPDLDGKVKVWINSTETADRTPLACVEAEISNGKTVNQAGVAWSLALTIGLCLVISGLMSGFGHFTTSAHVAAKSLAVMAYFQAQALIGMTSIPMPPIVRAWTQDFQWSMGIVRADFQQQFATWYQRATGGNPARLLGQLATTSVSLQKRSNEKSGNLKIKTLRGIERVSFVAKIEITNTFFTAYTFFVFVIVLVALSIAAFKGICELLTRARKMDPSRFAEFRAGWRLVVKGILLRLILIGCTPMIVLCLWELTRRDSVAEVVLAIFMLLFVITLLTIASLKIWRIARRSEQLHKSPAYMLYSDPTMLQKWGFLYIQYKATMTPFMLVVLIHALIRGAFVALAQRSGYTQAIALFILELALLIAVCVVKPYMDKVTNTFNISIAAINFFNCLLLLLLSGIFGLPPLAIGILGVLYFVINAIFAGTIVIMTIITAARAIISKDPDSQYQAMPDDRVSFVKSSTALETTELEALGKTARGESRQSFYNSLNADSRQNLTSRHPASRNASRTGFYAPDGRFQSQPTGFAADDNESRQRQVKKYEADWRPFGSEPNVSSAAKIRDMNGRY
ncbi:TRP-domain-containing protein [Microthyrium microscopicum]|uniref:TRP-domain-containing protein n=1 Tax=Microthyrium microscopicum TaxID=703497 RepID=A0A6A6UH68_9PEZI|nr:TRP-domain-containing protein [Microthyrium microscopicum]